MQETDLGAVEVSAIMRFSKSARKSSAFPFAHPGNSPDCIRPCLGSGRPSTVAAAGWYPIN